MRLYSKSASIARVRRRWRWWVLAAFAVAFFACGDDGVVPGKGQGRKASDAAAGGSSDGGSKSGTQTVSSCKTSLDCPQGLVCETAQRRCVDCVGDGDCSAGAACIDNGCRPACVSDKDCTPLGMLCDKAAKRCMGPT